MATNTTAVAKSTGNAWVVAISGPVEIDSINYVVTGAPAAVSVDLFRSGMSTLLLGAQQTEAGESGRVRMGVIRLVVGDQMRVRSDTPVDWILSGVIP